jgi:hypothetical protein
MTEVLEHLNSHFHVVAEVSRVVRSGGYYRQNREPRKDL